MNFEDLNKIFRDKGKSLGSVESFTGGLFASKVVDVPGASHFFKGGLVTYFTEEKVRLLQIPYSLVDEYGVVSSQIATEMALRGNKVLDVDYCISFTGNAGPDAMEGKPAGEVYIAISHFQKVKSFKFNIDGTRDEVRNKCCQIACDLLCECIKEF